MSGQSINLGEIRRVPRTAVPRPHGLKRDLPLVLYADALILATALAVWALKGGLSQAMTALGALSSLSLIVLIWFAIQYRTNLSCQGFLVLQAAWAYWYFVPMLLIAVRGQVYLDTEPRSFTAARIAQGCFAVLLSKFISTLVYQLMLARPVISVERLTRWLNRRSYRLPVLPVAAQLALGLVPFLFSGKPLLTAILSSRSVEGIFPKSNFAGSGGGAGSYLFTFFLISCCLLGFYRFFLYQSGSARWIFFLLGLTAFAVSTIAIATRTMLLATTMPFLTIYLLGSPDRWRSAKVVACLVGMWMGADILVNLRQQGFLERSAIQDNRSRNLTDNDFFGELLYAMEVVPDQVPFSYESPVKYALVTLIPRSLWPNKPVQENAERVMRIRINYLNGELGGNVLPGIVGQYWEVAGWLGVIVPGIWLGGAIALLDRLIVAANWHVRYFSFVFIWALFISFRTFALSNLLPALICTATVLALSRSNRFARN